MKRCAAAFLSLLVAGCSSPAPPDAGATLERSAIERGVVRDSASLTLTGLYAGGSDRMCMIERDETTRIGLFVDFGDGIRCRAQGNAVRDGERLRIDLGKDCAFDAGFDGDRVRFPGTLPGGCRAMCTRRASLSGLILDRLSDSASEAAALRDRSGNALCGDTEITLTAG